MSRELGVSRVLSWGRVFALLAGFSAFVIIPFMVWGEQMDARAPQVVRGQATVWAVALAGISLLVLDVVLPVPSSVVSIALCLLLGPICGAIAVFVGMVGAFTVGYLLGRLLPAARLRAWVGATTWDALAAGHLPSSLMWIAASRPVPVLAEVFALFAGSVRMPWWPSLASAATSSLLVACTYALTAALGLSHAESSVTVFILTASCVSTASWAAWRWLRRARLTLVQTPGTY